MRGRGWALMWVAIAGVVWLIFSVVVGTVSAGVAMGRFLAGLWFAGPLGARDRGREL